MSQHASTPQKWTNPANYDNCGILLHVRNRGLCFPFNQKLLFQFLVKINFKSVGKGTLSRISKRKRTTFVEISKLAQNVVLGISVPFDFPPRMVNDNLHFGKSTMFWIFFWTHNRTFHVAFSPVLKVQNFLFNGKCSLSMKKYCLWVSHI